MDMEAIEFLVKEESVTEVVPVQDVRVDDPLKDEPDWTTIKEEMKDELTIVEPLLVLEGGSYVTPTSSADEDDSALAGCGLGVPGQSSRHLSTDDHSVEKSTNHQVIPSLIILFDAKGVTCADCGKCFRTVSDLKIHLKVHSDREEYKCDHCGKCFFTGQCIKGHMPIHSYLTYKCKGCGECITRARNIKAHLRIHDDIKEYRCEQCGKCFKENEELKQHATTHSGMKDYECDHCGKYFSARHFLLSHLKYHSGIKNHQCDRCGKCFTAKNSLRIHLNGRCGVKKCDQCDKCFATGAGLAAHLKMHSKSIKYFKCPVGPMW